MWYKFALCVFFILCIDFVKFSDELKPGDTGVCPVKKTYRNSRYKSYKTTNGKWCGKKKCLVKKNKVEWYIASKTQVVCCRGFQYISEMDVCAPVCSPGCDVGICVAPNVCQSASTPVSPVTPICDPPCINAECTNNTCICNHGYESYNTTHCFHCDTGYGINEDFTCHPTCTPPCVNGNCTAPNVCTCNDGYSITTDSFRCEPVCEACVNGKCVSPNTCACYNGYERFNDTNCVPKCDNCNGRCVGPNECECSEGYNKTDSACVPICSGCENGVCSAPNVCDCNEGYVKNGTTQTCHKPCPEGCKVCEDGHCKDDTCIVKYKT